MSQSLLITLVRWEIIAMVVGLAVTITLKILTGQIDTTHLLYGRLKDGTRYFSPERVQLLVATGAMAMQYLLSAAHTDSGKFPSLPHGALAMLGLSNAVYLMGKGWTAFGFKPTKSKQEKE